MTLQVKVDLGVMAIEEYSTLPRRPELEFHHPMKFNVILRTPTFVGEGVLIRLLGDTVRMFYALPTAWSTE